jgi:hypothetical protein
MSGRAEAEELMRQDRQWVDPSTSLMAKPVELPPMEPIKDAPESEDEG